VKHIAPTLLTTGTEELRSRWQALLEGYPPDPASSGKRQGFAESAALVAFSYRIPNNAPLLLHKSSSRWKALYNSAIPEELRPIFGLNSPEQRIGRAAEAAGLQLADNLSTSDLQTIAVLSIIRGQWREGSEDAFAEMTGLTVPELMFIRRQATKAGLLRTDGRLTEDGQTYLRAGRRGERKRPDIPTSPNPYYPVSLRVPRGKSRSRRPSGRP
jgi:hypothetical protein